MRTVRGHRRMIIAAAATALVCSLVSATPVIADPGRQPAAMEAIGVESTAGNTVALRADPAVTDSVVRIYLAVLARQPDEAGLVYWVDQYHRGVALATIADGFMASPEWSARHGAIDDASFVDVLYHNVLRRIPDDEGRRYWIGALGTAVSRAEVLLQFSQSAEFVAKTGTTAPPPPHPPVPADSGTGRRIVYGNSAQRVWLVEAGGAVADSYPVSGRRDTPAPGIYSVYSKSPKAWAGHGGITMNHMIRFARGRSLAIGFHSIPSYGNGRPMQTLAQLGSYRSAGCVRQDPAKAEALYRWADIGTVVIVLD